MFNAHKSDPIPTRIVKKEPGKSTQTIKADICVLGAGIAGMSAATEAAKLGRKVVLVDGAPSLGGQAVGSIIGTIIGLYSHGGDNAYQLTHGMADDLINDLSKTGDIHKRQGGPIGTVTFQYDEVKLARWMERKVEELGIQALVSAVLTNVEFNNRRVRNISLATRFGSVCVEANGFVDASGDATLSFAAGLGVQEPVEPVYGTLNFLIEGYNLEAVSELDMEAIHTLQKEKGKEYGLVRHDGHLMHFPGKDFMLANIGHFETPLNPLEMANMVLKGRREADNVIRFLQSEFPHIFKHAKIRAYGSPGIRQTRWICSRKQLTLDDIRSAKRPHDAVARCAWWVELHNTEEMVHWERFNADHVYYIPLSCMVPKDADNIVAAGRCVDADAHALSAIRVMGPCIAMGAAAAHALDLAGTYPVCEVDLKKLRERLQDNLERTD